MNALFAPSKGGTVTGLLKLTCTLACFGSYTLKAPPADSPSKEAIAAVQATGCDREISSSSKVTAVLYRIEL